MWTIKHWTFFIIANKLLFWLPLFSFRVHSKYKCIILRYFVFKAFADEISLLWNCIFAMENVKKRFSVFWCCIWRDTSNLKWQIYALLISSSSSLFRVLSYILYGMKAAKNWPRKAYACVNEEEERVKWCAGGGFLEFRADCGRSEIFAFQFFSFALKRDLYWVLRLPYVAWKTAQHLLSCRVWIGFHY